MPFTILFNNQKEHDEYCIAVAKKLNRTPEVKVIKAAEFLKGKKTTTTKRGFTEQEDEFLISNYGKIEPKAIANALGKSKASVIGRANQLRKQGKPIFRYDTPLVRIHDKYLDEGKK